MQLKANQGMKYGLDMRDCSQLQSPATPDRSFVKRLGQRFESARRIFACAIPPEEIPMASYNFMLVHLLFYWFSLLILSLLDMHGKGARR